MACRAGGVNGWSMEARQAALQQSAPLLLAASGLTMTSVPFTMQSYPLVPRDDLAGG